MCHRIVISGSEQPEHQFDHCLVAVCDHFSHGVWLVDYSFTVTFGLCVEVSDQPAWIT